MSAAVSPLAPRSVPAMPAIPGVKLGTAAAGIKYANRTDVMLAVFQAGTTVAGVFTTSKCPSAPVASLRDRLKGAKPRPLGVHSGNLNYFTRKSGLPARKFTADHTARRIRRTP